jgi:hypothetical protein
MDGVKIQATNYTQERFGEPQDPMIEGSLTEAPIGKTLGM